MGWGVLLRLSNHDLDWDQIHSFHYSVSTFSWSFFLIQCYIPTGQTVIQCNLGSLKLGFLATLRRNNLYEHSDLNMKYMIQAMKKISLDGYNLQWWLYWREHLKYVWNVYCVATNHRWDLHTTETTGNEQFPVSHGTNYFHFVLTFSLFTSKQLLFLPICLQYLL